VSEPPRCAWPKSDLDRAYHDREWGVPLHDDRMLFEFLVLEGAQAGLSWSTILKRREAYRAAYRGFDPLVVAGFGEEHEARLLADAGIIRNRAKVRSSIVNAQAFITVQQEFGSFDAYIWSFVDGEPIQNAWHSLDQLPATTPLSQEISADLRRRGFTFVGPTIVYAHMQATGMVNDHVVGCFRHAELGGAGG
jgi:DNA-3-methyladenine glycosylase I